MVEKLKSEGREKARNRKTKSNDQIHWGRLAVGFLSLIVLSFGLAYLLNRLVAKFNLPLYDFAWLAYLIVFATTLVANLTIIAPVPFAVSMMVAAATRWNPLLVAFFGSIGGILGELSGYYAGYLGKKIAISEDVILYKRVEQWLQRYGMWALPLLAFQPIIPFDIAGLIAGVARMPLYKFLLALWLGKFPKFVLLTYAGVGLVRFLPSWFL